MYTGGTGADEVMACRKEKADPETEWELVALF